MRRCLLRVIFLILAVISARADDVSDRVVILANSADPESLKLADYYATRRGIPKANIVVLNLPLKEDISWREFVDQLLNPLQAELVKRGWIDAIGMDLKDAIGRKKYVISGHKISYLVTCRGVPVKINNDPALPAETSPLAAANAAFQCNNAAVDSELALLAMGNQPCVAFVPNPLFHNDRPSTIQLNQIVKIGRLDGPSLKDAKALVDNALEGEKNGVIGRSYVDIGGPHALGDRWLEEAAKQLNELGFDGDVDRAGGPMPVWARFDAPVLYFGWYAGHASGPFMAPNFRFPPGAIALHIHSYSADVVRTTDGRWVGPLVARGVTGTFGNAFEPYLELTHQPQLIIKSLARGDRFGDAAAYSVPAYSWQPLTVGDPLYRPFAVSFEEQWARRDKLPADLRPYVVLRRMRQLEKAGDRNAAIAAGIESEKDGASLAVALATAQLQQANGGKAGVTQTLAWVLNRRSFTVGEAPVAALLAQFLKEIGDVQGASIVWQRVLSVRSLARDARLDWLPKALEAGRAANLKMVAHWDEELRELTAPTPAAVP